MGHRNLQQYNRFEIFTPQTDIFGIALVVHGLNLKPTRMLAIVEQLREQGMIVINMSLSGHRGDYNELLQVSRSSWLADYSEALRLIEKLQDQYGQLPAFFVGKSLGALSFVDFVSESSDSQFEGAIFLAPAFELRPSSYLLKIFDHLSPRIPIPSASRRKDRIYNRLPVHCYRALYDVLAHVHKKLKQKPFAIPSLMYIHPKDELISYKRIMAAIEKKYFINTKVINLQYFCQTGAGFYHVQIDEETMGPICWKAFCEDLAAFLNS